MRHPALPSSPAAAQARAEEEGGGERRNAAGASDRSRAKADEGFENGRGDLHGAW